MGKVGWYSLALAVLCTVALLCVPWTVRISLMSAAAVAAEDDGLLSLLPEDVPLDLNAGSTATDSGLASNPLAGSAPAATKQMPSAAPAVKPASSLLDSRQQELSLNTTAAVAEKSSPSAVKPGITQAKLAASSTPAAPKAVQPQTKPKPAAKPKSAAKAPAKPAVKQAPAPAKAEKASTSTTGSSFIGGMDLPEATNPKLDPSQPAPSLRELFTPEEIDDPLTDSAVVASTGVPDSTTDVPPIAMEHGGTLASVIDTGHTEDMGGEDSPTLGQILRGEAEDSEVGSSLAGYNPVRSGAMVLLVLALLFVGAWLAKRLRNNTLPGFKQKALVVIETVSIGPGRQLIIVEMNNDALVLGVTPHSINMLDKVPLAELNGSYQHTVNAIIEREESALPADWQERPLFTPSARVSPAPALAAAGTYGPSGRMTVQQVRQSGGYGAQARGGPGIVPTHLLQERNTKAVLIDRIRQQLSNLES